jgi:hypothetical protein
MKFYSTLLIGSLLAFTAVSCNKNKNDIPAPAQPALNEKLLVQTDYDEEIKISYNADRTVKEYVQDENGLIFKTTFTYAAGTVTEVQYYNNKKTSERILSMQNGRIAKYAGHQFDDNGNVTLTLNVQYTYDGNGKLKQRVQDDGYTTEYIYGQDGNLAEELQYWNGVLHYKTKYEYYADLEEKLTSFNVMHEDGWGGFLPQFSNKLIKRKTFTNIPQQYVGYDGVYTYELDADGYVIKGKSVNVVNNGVWQWTNVYQ